MNFEEENEKLKLTVRDLELKIYNLQAALKRHNLKIETPIDNGSLYKDAYKLLLHYQEENAILLKQLNHEKNSKDDSVMEWRTKYDVMSSKYESLVEKNRAISDEYLTKEKNLNDEITTLKFRVLSLQDQNDELIKMNENLQRMIENTNADKSLADASLMLSEYRDDKRSEIYQKWKHESSELKKQIYQLNQEKIEICHEKDEVLSEIDRLNSKIWKLEEDHKLEIEKMSNLIITDNKMKSILDIDENLGDEDFKKLLDQTCSRIIKTLSVRVEPKQEGDKKVQFDSKVNDISSINSTLGASELKSPLVSNVSEVDTNDQSQFTDCDLSEMGSTKYVPNATSTQLRSDIPKTPARDSVFITPTNHASKLKDLLDKSVTDQSVVFGQNNPSDLHSYITNSAKKLYSIANSSKANAQLDQNTFTKMKFVYQDLAHSIQLLDSIISNKKLPDSKLKENENIKNMIMQDAWSKFKHLLKLLTGETIDESWHTDSNDKENVSSFCQYNETYDKLRVLILKLVESHREASRILTESREIERKISKNVSKLVPQVETNA